MFRGVLIHASSDRAHVLRYLVAAADCVQIQRDFDGIPNEHELRRTLIGLYVEVAVIDLQHPASLTVASQLREFEPNLVIIGFGPSLETSLLASKAGVDEVLGSEATPSEFRASIQDQLRRKQSAILPGLFCFLPAKAGSGCSTITMNVAVSLAQDESKRVLVIDADLRSGVMALLLGTEARHSLQSVLAGIQNLDVRRIEDFVYSAYGVDFLLSSHSLDANHPEWSDYFHLLSLVTPHYDAILVDLPELINPATYELVRRAVRVFVTSTAELPALALTRQRCDELSRLNLPQERTGILINRWQRSDPSLEEIAAMIHHPVLKAFPNDYPGVRSALLAGQAVSRTTRLGTAYCEFAAELTGKKTMSSSGFVGKIRSFWGHKEVTRVS